MTRLALCCLLLLLAACLLTCMGQIAQKYAVEGWRGQPAGWALKLCSPWLWSALLCLGLLRPLKGLMIAAQIRNKASEHRRDELG